MLRAFVALVQNLKDVLKSIHLELESKDTTILIARYENFLVKMHELNPTSSSDLGARIDGTSCMVYASEDTVPDEGQAMFDYFAGKLLSHFESKIVETYRIANEDLVYLGPVEQSIEEMADSLNSNFGSLGPVFWPTMTDADKDKATQALRSWFGHASLAIHLPPVTLVTSMESPLPFELLVYESTSKICVSVFVLWTDHLFSRTRTAHAEIVNPCTVPSLRT